MLNGKDAESERARLRLEVLDGERLEHHRLVREAVVFRMPERVTHPVLVVALRIVAVSVGTTAFLAGLGRDDGGLGDLDQVGQLQRLDAGRVEHLGLVAQVDVLGTLDVAEDLAHTFGEQCRGTEHAAVRLHVTADVAGHVLHPLARGGTVELGHACQREVATVDGQRLVFLVLEAGFDDVVAGGTAEHHQVEQ